MKKINKAKININGKKYTINPKMTLKKALAKFKIPLDKVAIELNHEIVDKKNLNNVNIKKNDEIEIVHFIGGG